MAFEREYSKFDVIMFLLKWNEACKEAKYTEMDPFKKAEFFSDWLSENDLKYPAKI